MKDGIILAGWFDFWCLENKRILWQERAYNGIVNTALNDILSVYLAAGTQKPNWFIGLIDNTGFITLAPGDTIGSHNGWVESVAYNQAGRPAWTPGQVVNQLISNPSVINFTINAVTTIRGAFLVSNTTKGGSTGLLWSAGVFETPQTLSNPPQTLSVSYSLAAGGS